LANPNLTLDSHLPFTIRGCRSDRGIQDGEILVIGDLLFTVMHTPGHSPGSICLYSEQQHVLFTGDTLMAGEVGRTNLPGGNAQALAESLARLGKLPSETRVFPGHGRPTTIAAESWIFQLTA
jgi:glyoxylase-like metal-dependent hydrolase (beta-lactamase superfamily II)